MRLVLTIVLALAFSGVAAFAALFMCALLGQVGISLQFGVLAAVPAAFLALVAFTLAATRQRPRVSLMRVFWILIAISLAFAVSLRLLVVDQTDLASNWTDDPAFGVMTVCAAVVFAQWLTFRSRTLHVAPLPPPLRFGRQSER